MVGPSIIFYVFFGIPYILVMYWLIKQDKRKRVLGMVVVTLIAVLGFLVSRIASKNAVLNYKQHQIDARQIEAKDSIK